MRLDKVYSKRFEEKSWKQRDIMWKTLCDEFFNRFVDTEDDVLDLAAGYCDFINNVAYDSDNSKLGRRIAVDLNPDVRKHAKQHVETYISDAKNLTNISENSIDVVFVSNFFEHVREKDEILDILTEILRVLKINGKLMILQPNINYLGGKYWDFFDHYTPINESSMREALCIVERKGNHGRTEGYSIGRLIKKFLPYTTKSRIPQKAWMIRLYCHCPFAWHVMGKQMFVMAEKVEK